MAQTTGFTKSDYDVSNFGFQAADALSDSPFLRNGSLCLSEDNHETPTNAQKRGTKKAEGEQGAPHIKLHSNGTQEPVRIATLAQSISSRPDSLQEARTISLAHGISPRAATNQHYTGRTAGGPNRSTTGNAGYDSDERHDANAADDEMVRVISLMPKAARGNAGGISRPMSTQEQFDAATLTHRNPTPPANSKVASPFAQHDPFGNGDEIAGQGEEDDDDDDDAHSVFRVGKLIAQLPPIRTTMPDRESHSAMNNVADPMSNGMDYVPRSAPQMRVDDEADIANAADEADDRTKRQPGNQFADRQDWKIPAYRVEDGDIIDIDGLTTHLEKMIASATSNKAVQQQLVKGEGLSGLRTAVDALGLKGTDASTVAAQTAACNLLTVLASNVNNAPALGRTEVINALVPMLKSERHCLRHAALQFLDCLTVTAATPVDKEKMRDGASSRATDRGGSRAGDRGHRDRSKSHHHHHRSSTTKPQSATIVTKIMKALDEAGALKALLGILRKSSASGGCLGCAQRAASLMYTMTSCEPAARDEVVAGGGVEGLLRTLESGDSRPRAQHAAARLMLDLAASSRSLARELVDSGAVPVLANILRCKETAGEILFTVAATLKYLCEEPVAQWVLSEDRELLDAICNTINSRNPYLQVASTRLVARLANVLDPEALVASGLLEALTWAGRLGDDKRRIMGHTARSACALSLCQILVAALDTGDDISASSDFVRNQKVKTLQKNPQLIVETLQKIPGILPLMLELLAEGWEDFRPMSVSILSVLAASEDMAVKMSESDDLINTLTELLASKDQVSEMGAARTLTELGQCNPDVVIRLLEDEAVLESIVLALRRAGHGHASDPKSLAHKLTLALLSLLDCLSNDPELLGTRHAWRMVSNATLMRLQVELMMGRDPVAAQSAARLIYNVSVFRAAAVEAVLIPDLVSALLSVSSASLRPPPEGAQHLVEQVTAASHTALCAIARLVSHGSRTATTELLTFGVVPLLAAMVNSQTTQMVLRRASLVALVDLCQGHEDQDEHGGNKDKTRDGDGKWGSVEGEANISIASNDILVQAAREQLVMMQGIAALSALVHDDEEVSGSTANALIDVLASSCPTGRRAVVDHNFATLVRKHFLRNKPAKAAKA